MPGVGGAGGGAPRAAPTEPSVLFNLLPHVLQTFQREPALAITLCYLLIAMAGIFYDVNFYARLGIPILTLSQVGDLLVAGLQQPVALLLVVSTFPLCWLFDKLNQRRRRARAARRERILADTQDGWVRRVRLFVLTPPPRWVTGLMYLGIVVIYGWNFVYLYTKYRVEAVRKGEGAKVMVWVASSSEPLAAQSGSWTYLGAVSSYVLLYDVAAQRPVILPVNSIGRIEPVPPARPASLDAVAPIR